MTALTAALFAALSYGCTAAEQTRPRPAPQPVQPGSIRPTTVVPNVQEAFENYVGERKVPGIVGAFGMGELPTSFPAAGKIADDVGAPSAGPDSLWRVYSMTKPITGIAAMILVEDGKLHLDQPISKFFPAFANMRVLTKPETSLESVPAKTPITVRHLLTHTAGLGYTIVTKGPLLKEYERLGLVPATVNTQTEAAVAPRRPKTLAAFAERVATLPLIAEPGTKWSYSIGLDVMAAVIEKASAMTFERFVQTRIFTPLRMNSSYWTVPADQADRLATNYSFNGDVRVPIDPATNSAWLRPPSFPYGGAGLVMSARDYDRFLHMLANEGTLHKVRVMKPNIVRLAMSNLLPAGVTFAGVRAGTGGTISTVPMGFGAGGSVYLADGPGGYPSKGTYGWGGAAGTFAFVDPVKKLRATVMVNYFPADKWPIRQEIVAAFARDAARVRR
jgi:CubicO group peptidase (beta-lactamase class C family)